jgi:glycosyltransferase involved in cell wall biosynthesis
MTSAPGEILFFGGYDPAYPRNAIIRKGLERNGVRVSECAAGSRLRAVFRYPLLTAKFLAGGMWSRSPVFVPDFRHKDVPLAWLFTRVTRRKLIFDPLVSRYETRVLDRGDTEEGSAQAKHNWNIDRVSMRMADMVLADSDAHADFFSDEFGIPRKKIKTLYLGFDDTVFVEAPARAQEEIFNVLFYGSFLPLHGTDVIVDAARLLDERFRFRVVGSGQTMEEFRRRAEGLEGVSIELSGNVPESDLPGLIAAADAVLGVFGTTPKTGLVIPNKVYQSMACRRPVVTAETRAIREIFEPGKHIVCVDPGDASGLAGALRRLRDDRDYALSVGREGAALVRDRYNPGKVAARLVEILGEAFR